MHVEAWNSLGLETESKNTAGGWTLPLNSVGPALGSAFLSSNLSCPGLLNSPVHCRSPGKERRGQGLWRNPEMDTVMKSG